MNSRISVGSPESSSALCSACSLVSLKSCHTAHSPVASASAPGGKLEPRRPWPSARRPTRAGRRRRRPREPTGTSAARPSGLIKPGVGGLARAGRPRSSAAGLPCSAGDERCEAGRVVGDRCRLAVGDDRRLGAELREVLAQLVADLLRRSSPAPPTQHRTARRSSVTARGAAASTTTAQTSITRRGRRAPARPTRPRTPACGVTRSVVGEAREVVMDRSFGSRCGQEPAASIVVGRVRRRAGQASLVNIFWTSATS